MSDRESAAGTLFLPLENAMTFKRDSHPGLCPTLAPLFGGPDKKLRFLDKDVVAVGRARGCDITLEANEVSAIHCIFYRAPLGMRVRDCGSRTGTRVNGNPVKNAALTDGDILQIGPFSFELKIPAELAAPPAIDPRHLERSQRSRQNLARLAWRLRHRLRRAEAGQSSQADKAADLKAKIRSYDQKFSQLEESEQELAAEREQLTKDREAHRQRVQQVENDLARRLEETEKQIRARWAEFQQHCAEETARLQTAQAAAVTPTPEALEQLESRRRELAELENRLKDQQAACVSMDRQIREAHEHIERERRDLAARKSRWDAEQAQARAEAEKQHTSAQQAEANLRAQKAELARMLNDLKQLQDEMRQQPRGDFTALQQENQELRETVAALEQRLANSFDRERVEELLVEQDQARHALREEIEKLRQQLAQTDAGPNQNDELAALRAENETLQQILQQRLLEPTESPAPQISPADQERIDAQERELNQLRAEVERLSQLNQPQYPSPASGDEGDLESYEAELNRFRHQLEKDRAALNKEMETVRARNAELDEAIREMEMEMSRERAEMARERTRLERMRDEIKAEMERIQRDGGVRESLASFQRLREEMKTAGSRR